jgi:hypothetical protein
VTAELNITVQYRHVGVGVKWPNEGGEVMCLILVAGTFLIIALPSLSAPSYVHVAQTYLRISPRA